MLDCATFSVTVARAGRVALRTTDGVFVSRARDVVVGGFTLRAVVAARAMVALRALRAVVVVRATLRFVAVRAAILFVVLRPVWLSDAVFVVVRSMVFCVVAARVMEFAPRSAALVIPTPHISAVTKNTIFFIRNIIGVILPKKV